MMTALLNLLTTIGDFMFQEVWFPLLIWTIIAVPVTVLLHRLQSIPPAYQYHGRMALLFALPLGIIGSHLLDVLGSSAATAVPSTKFFVIQNPIPASPAAEPSMVSIFADPMLWIGLVGLLMIAGAVYSLMAMTKGLIGLWNMENNLSFNSLHYHTAITNHLPRIDQQKWRQTQIAFSSDAQTPFTYGWPRTKIVIPKRLEGSPEALAMAVQHELTHIKHRDFLLNGILMAIKSLFWIHPLTHYLHKSCQEYREITCDSEVLATNHFSKKRYASFLFDLAQHKPRTTMAMNMAINPSTLKKRIQNMSSNTSTYNAFNTSFYGMLVSLLVLTGVISCSDMQSSADSSADLLSQQLNLSGAEISVNGKEIIDMPKSEDDKFQFKGPANAILKMTLDEYGTFLISGRNFTGARPVGTVNGNELSFTVNELTVDVSTPQKMLKQDQANFYVAHDASYAIPSKNGKSTAMSWFSNYEEYKNYRDIHDLKDAAKTAIEKSKKNQGKDFYRAVEEMPKLKGGLNSIQSQLKYPEMAVKAGIEGTVNVDFIVDKNGNVENPQILRGIGGGCDEEALRVVKKAKFEPAMHKGELVRVKYSVPIRFQLPPKSGG
jgi:TonB family protein